MLAIEWVANSILAVRPALVNTLFPVTCPHQIYSTALVIIIVIDNLKYVVIFVYVCFLPWKVLEVYENVSQCASERKFGQTHCSMDYDRIS